MDFFRRGKKEFIAAALASQLAAEVPQELPIDTQFHHNEVHVSQPPEILSSADRVLDVTADKTVVLFGERHNIWEDEAAVLTLLQELRQQGFTTLAIEKSHHFQPYIDQLLSGEEVDLDTVYGSMLMRDAGLVAFIRHSHDMGFSILCIDQRNLASSGEQCTPSEFDDFLERDRYMFERIQQAVDDGQRVVGFVGAYHASTADRVPHAFEEVVSDSGIMRVHDIESPLGYRLRQQLGDQVVSIDIRLGSTHTEPYTDERIQVDYVYTDTDM